MLTKASAVSGIKRVFNRFITSQSIIYSKFGDPKVVLENGSKKFDSFTNEEVLVKVCASPINPADINTIQGLYPIKPSLPAIGGNEGVGKVILCGKNVKKLSVGDYVIPNRYSSGTWQTYWCSVEEDFIKVKYPSSTVNVSVMSVNPCTALCLLTDFCELQKGDFVIQNGSTSAAGLYVIQIAKLLGLRTVNLFRDRVTQDGTEATRRLLMDYGADYALTETEFSNRKQIPDHEELGPFKLALNCLGGKPAINLMKSLDHGGTMVTYGGMTRSPMPIPVGPFIFKDIRLRGFWLSRLNKQISHQEKLLKLDQIGKWFHENRLKPSPFIEIPFSEWPKAISLSLFKDELPTDITKKVILIMD